MVIGDEDKELQEAWSGTTKPWYNEAADKDPQILPQWGSQAVLRTDMMADSLDEAITSHLAVLNVDEG